MNWEPSAVRQRAACQLDEILALEPDVILVDFLMPGKDGVELVRELKEKGCGARCIMISPGFGQRTGRKSL